MATNRNRHMVSESDEIRNAIDVVIEASGRAMSRADALRYIMQQGIRALDPQRVALRTQRLQAIERIRTNNEFRDIWPANWKEEMLADWPE